MGEKKVSTKSDEHQLRVFTKAVLNDLQALEKMLKDDMMEDNALRIGAEQEMFLVDSSMHPALTAMQILENAKDSRLTTEIGQFNLEANLTPLEFSGDCLQKLENELLEIVGIVRETARNFNSDVVLAGILPTLQNSDLIVENLTPMPRYYELNRILTELHGENRLVHIKGLDEINLTLQDAVSEACNTSFQVHLQVPGKDFVNSYNWAQALAAPILASAVNSPMLFGRRLWHETRLALFQQATDTRSVIHQSRNQTPRVTFGRDWVRDSILEIFHEDVARYRIILTRELEEDSLKTLEKGEIPELSAWRMHNGTIWRWNRACYGIMDGKPSLRIEARFLPSGPSIADEMANSAFFLGLMMALPKEFSDVTKLMSFDEARNNFFTAARYGLKSQFVWFNGKSYRTSRLILEELLPRARHGLRSVNIDSADIERYLGIIEERVSHEKTGSQWVLDSWTKMNPVAKANVRLRSLTATMKKYQEINEPVHKWKLAVVKDKSEWIDNYLTVEQFMTRDLFTVRPEDVIDLAANLMNWKHIRHVPVEDDKGNLIGIISYRDLLELIASEQVKKDNEIVVRDIMKTDLIIISPETPTLKALNLMREKKIGCLPVVKDQKLIGLLTSHDFLTVSTKLFEERLKEINNEKSTFGH
ncbi:MAG: CBS domain-containing protein [Pyrinomonadaceae bacterium]|nr:CBS domain-containing protein [Pyrinomonadaceae bacterium]